MADDAGKTSWRLSGDPISSGFAIGEAFLFRQINLSALEKTKFPIDDVAKEHERLDGIVRKTMAQLHEIVRQENLSEAVSEIFHVQMRILEDADFLNELKTMIDAQNANVEYVLSNRIRLLEKKFHSMENELLRTRFLDIQDVYYRILRNSLEIEHVRDDPSFRYRGG